MTRERDTELVERYLESRGEDEFRALYKEHSPYLYRLALRFAGGRSDEAEDALQEAWIRAADRLAGFRWESALRTWLGGFVFNCCREIRRRRRPEVDLEAVEEPRTHPGTHTGLDLERLMAALPDSQRDVLVLFAIEGYTHEEIAHRLDIPTGTSKSRLFDARRNLRHWRDTALQTGETS